MDELNWAIPRHAISWGRLVTNIPSQACMFLGLPEVGQSLEFPTLMQIPGVINPGDGFPADHYLMTLNHPERAKLDQLGGSPWAGASGSAVFRGALLLGIIAEHFVPTNHDRLVVVPAYRLLRERAARTLLAEHGIPQHSDPGELQKLAHFPTRQEKRSPASLLEATQRVVRFRGVGRAETLDRLRVWCREDDGFDSHIIHGPAGQGKTRLACELVDALRTEDRDLLPHGMHWTTLWLGDRTSPEKMARISCVNVPLLIVVDSAESRLDQMTDLLNACSEHSGDVPIRLLILARSCGSWWTNFRANAGLSRGLLDDTITEFLSPLENSFRGLSFAYREAVQDFTLALPSVKRMEGADWGSIAASITPTWEREQNTLGDGPPPILSVHMAALADLLDAADRAAGVEVFTSGRRLEERLLDHERRYWNTTTEAREFSSTTTAERERALALAFLVGAADAREADNALTSLPGLNGDTAAAQRELLSTWISSLYPPSAPDLHWGTLKPDRLAEFFVGQELMKIHPAGGESGALAVRSVGNLSNSQNARLLMVYARAAAHPAVDGALDRPLQELVAGSLQLAFISVRVMQWVMDNRPLKEGIKHLVRESSIQPYNLKILERNFPFGDPDLADIACFVSRELVICYESCRWSPDYDYESTSIRFADALSNHSLRLLDLDKPDAALSCAEGAFAIYEEVPSTRVLQNRYREELMLNIGTAYLRKSSFESAASVALRAINEISHNSDQVPPGLCAVYMKLLIVYADALRGRGLLGEAAEAYQRAVLAFDVFVATIDQRRNVKILIERLPLADPRAAENFAGDIPREELLPSLYNALHCLVVSRVKIGELSGIELVVDRLVSCAEELSGLNSNFAVVVAESLTLGAQVKLRQHEPLAAFPLTIRALRVLNELSDMLNLTHYEDILVKILGLSSRILVEFRGLSADGDSEWEELAAETEESLEWYLAELDAMHHTESDLLEPLVHLAEIHAMCGELTKARTRAREAVRIAEGMFADNQLDEVSLANVREFGLQFE
ncbi:hypothetical protein [Streptomyces sp. IB201691-2A2]|uniref:hypothetical protein n=1 Tax=Streptomyces sp. IB201691-2A2 TaxID=2561920 RepID=UPI00117FE59E|nr:hypothetical protein [Streptomyces sp. IB201691-2A2]TRO68213.1 hypothetical protein E4K73_05045 [Streptomyces sp. IB201691-2A2]